MIPKNQRAPTFLDKILATIGLEEEPAREKKPQTEIKRRRAHRKDFFYYKIIIDQETGQAIGHLSDISSGGFKVDSQTPLLVDKEYRLGISLNNDIADTPKMEFVARSRWCKVDPFDPNIYNIGFQLVHISSSDMEIFSRMIEKYSREFDRRLNFRHPNKW